MGGASSSTKINKEINVVNDAIMESTNECKTETDMSNLLNFSGSGNVISGLRQRNVASFRNDCSLLNPQSADYVNKLASTINTSTENSTGAVFGLLDNSSASSKVNVKTNIASALRQSVVSKCINNLTQKNIVSFIGDQNKLSNVDQDNIADLVTSCIMDTKQTASINNDLNLTESLRTSNKVDNLLQPFTDAFTTTSQSFMIMVVVIIIVVMCFGAAYVYFVGLPTGESEQPKELS